MNIASSHGAGTACQPLDACFASCCLRPLAPACRFAPLRFATYPVASAATWGAGRVVVLGHQSHLANAQMDSPLGLFIQNRQAFFAGWWLLLHAWQFPAARCVMHVHLQGMLRAPLALCNLLRQGSSSQRASHLQCASPLFLQREVGIPADIR